LKIFLKINATSSDTSEKKGTYRDNRQYQRQGWMVAHSTQARHFSLVVEMSCQMEFSCAIKNPTQGQRIAIISP
jgi:hypothetical protein